MFFAVVQRPSSLIDSLVVHREEITNSATHHVRLDKGYPLENIVSRWNDSAVGNHDVLPGRSVPQEHLNGLTFE